MHPSKGLHNLDPRVPEKSELHQGHSSAPAFLFSYWEKCPLRGRSEHIWLEHTWNYLDVVLEPCGKADYEEGTLALGKVGGGGKGFLIFKGKASPRPECAIITQVPAGWSWAVVLLRASQEPNAFWSPGQPLSWGTPTRLHITSWGCLNHLLLYRCSKSSKYRTIFPRDKLVWKKSVWHFLQI